MTLIYYFNFLFTYSVTVERKPCACIMVKPLDSQQVSVSHSRSEGRGTCHGPDRLLKGPQSDEFGS